MARSGDSLVWFSCSYGSFSSSAGRYCFIGRLIVITWPDRRVSTVEILRNLASVYLGNLTRSVGSTVLVYFSGTLSLRDSVAQSATIAIAKGKTALSFLDAFMRGILCNVPVCFAVWTSFAAHHVAGKVIAIVLPVSMFVTLGFEHLVANMYFIPLLCSQAWKTSISRASSLIFCLSPSATS